MKEFLSKILGWIKNNKLSTVLLAILAYIFFANSFISLLGARSRSVSYMDSAPTFGAVGGTISGMGYDMAEESAVYNSKMAPTRNVAPQPGVTDRKVITNSNMSIKVKSVRDTLDIIKASVFEMGGYMVEENINTPEFGESGSIAVRIPSDKMDMALDRFRKLAVKVVSENISGKDITDQYIDLEGRIARLESTKTRFEIILLQADKIEDILRVQREIFNLQDQIDGYKGQLNYYDGASSTTLMRIYLSTDELGLPYTPAQAWRPEAVFRQATRSLLMNLISLGNTAIWLVVYLPLILVLIVAFKLIKRAVFKKQ